VEPDRPLNGFQRPVHLKPLEEVAPMSLFRSTSTVKTATPQSAIHRRKLWDEFRNDRKTLATLRVTADEVARLQTVVMLSGFTEKRQLIGALNRIRAGFQP